MRPRSFIATLALVALGALGGCRSFDDACPVRCGDRCLPASACAGLVCPADAPCDPCTGQCRPACDDAKPCTDPALSCCAGACVDPTSDHGSCGGCGRACGADADRCAGGSCACGEGAACGAGSLCCGGACVVADAQNCGGCGAVCGEGETCDLVAGGCRCGTKVVPQRACADDQACCSGTCVGVKDDAQNCGGCSRSCGAGVACKDGRCDCSMAGCQDAAQTCCKGGCASLPTDELNCGGCGLACGTSEVCTDSQCACGTTKVSGAPACAASQTCCPGGCFNLMTSQANCGACGRTCNAATTIGCANGTCACKAGYAPRPGDPTRCDNINECASAGTCAPANALCHDLVGSYQCTCQTNYEGNPYAQCCSSCTLAPPREGIVPQCDPSIYNDTVRTVYVNSCGNTVACGDCCHAGAFCAGNQCIKYRCACGDSGTMAACQGSGGGWQGDNCCHFAQATSCVNSSDCPP